MFGYNVTEPTPATVTVIDGSSGTYVQDTSHGGYIIQCPSGSSNCLAILKANPGSGAYYVDIAFMTYIPGTNGGNGVCLADGTSTSNKLVNSRLGYESSNWPILERQRWNSVNSWNSNASILSGGSNGLVDVWWSACLVQNLRRRNDQYHLLHFVERLRVESTVSGREDGVVDSSIRWFHLGTSNTGHSRGLPSRAFVSSRLTYCLNGFEY